MKKILRAIPIVILLSLMTTITAMGSASQRRDALIYLEWIERLVHVGKAGSIGMADAGRPSMLAALLDYRPLNDNALHPAALVLVSGLEELEASVQALDTDEFDLLEQESLDATGFTFSERLVILEEKLAQILDLLPDSNIFSPERKLQAIAQVENSLQLVRGLTARFNTICADFSGLAEGLSVVGSDRVAPNLNISSDTGGAVKIEEGGDVIAYGSPNDLCGVEGETYIFNNLIAADGGFSDLTAVGGMVTHSYVFSFEGATVRSFSLHMWDFGDYNPMAATDHRVEMLALDGSGGSVAAQVIQYTTPAESTPNESSPPDYGDLQCNSGDATAGEGYPGNWAWDISGESIAEVRLTFPSGHDPYIGFDTLCFVVEP